MTEDLLNYFEGDELAATTWENKYALKDDSGKPIETNPEQMHKRLAREFWRAEKDFIDKASFNKADLSEYGQKRKDLSEEAIFKLFDKFKYIIPAGSVMAGAGSGKPVSLSNCFVLPTMPEDSYSSIMLSRGEMVQLEKRRGGTGADLSKLRPRGAKVNNAAKTSTGAASFMEGFSAINNEVAQEGRRGALMLTISICHPDAEEFIMSKQDLTKITGANISVKIPDDFMEAVEKDSDYLLRWPVNSIPFSTPVPIEEMEYGKLYEMSYLENQFMSCAIPGGYCKKIKAKELWNKLIHCAWATAEPGILFESTLHNYAPDGVYPEFKAVSTNPCVVGDTEVLARISGEEKTVKVKDLVSMELENIEVLSFNLYSSEVEWKELQRAQITKRCADVITLVVSTNGADRLEIKLTPDHKVYSIDSQGYIEAGKLNIGNLLWVYKEGRLVKAQIVLNVICSKREDVFDLTVKDNHNFFANGILVKNCGEIPMSSGDSCRLIHVNLSSFVDNAFKDNAEINYNKLYSVSYEATRLGDDLVALEEEAVERILSIVKDGDPEKDVWTKILNSARRGRRAGVGFLGLSDMIAMLGLRYCSPECLKVVDEVCKTMMRAELDSTIDMAVERGFFPGYREEYEYEYNDWYRFVKETYPEQWTRMKKYGRRNVSFSTVAPTGSVAMISRTSSGIEPVFMPVYSRRRKCNSDTERVDFVDKMGIKFQEFVVVHPGLEKWAMEKYPNENLKDWKLDKWQEVYKKSPWYGSTSAEIDWEKRVELQGIVQKYITHAISSTVNLPNSITEEEVARIYMTAWKTGNKGQTVYRDGCRDGILVSAQERKRDEKFRSYVEAPKRPKVLPADFYTTKVKGELFYVMVGLYLDKPYEIFVFKPDLKENEKPPKQHRGEITKIKRGVYTFKSDLFTIENISKDLSPNEYTVVLFSSMLLRTGANIKYVIKTAQKAKDGINGFTSALVRILSKYSPEELLKGEVCPECGSELTREGGCIICKNCGYSKCL